MKIAPYKRQVPSGAEAY